MTDIAALATKVAALEEQLRLMHEPLFKRVAMMAESWRLTEREAQVLELIVQAYTNKDIGVRLGIAEGTVEVHVSRLLMKSRCPSRAALIVAAYTGVVP